MLSGGEVIILAMAAVVLFLTAISAAVGILVRLVRSELRRRTARRAAELDGASRTPPPGG